MVSVLKTDRLTELENATAEAEDYKQENAALRLRLDALRGTRRIQGGVQRGRDGLSRPADSRKRIPRLTHGGAARNDAFR